MMSDPTRTLTLELLRFGIQVPDNQAEDLWASLSTPLKDSIATFGWHGEWPPNPPNHLSCSQGCTGTGDTSLSGGGFPPDHRFYWYSLTNTYEVFYDHGKDRLNMTASGPRCTASEALYPRKDPFNNG